MKLLFLLIFLSKSAFGIDSLLISGFDPFGSANENNSRIMAKKLVTQLKAKYPTKEIEFCELPTKFHKATETLKDCLNSMSNRAKIVLSLGEAGCEKPRLETRAKNLMDNYTPDNDGLVYSEEIINPEMSTYHTRMFNWNEAYCDLEREARNNINFSKSAGTFVCNETLFNMSQLPDIAYGFIHVPSSSCTATDNKLFDTSINTLSKLLEKIVETKKPKVRIYPVHRSEIQNLLQFSRDKCYRSILKKIR